MTDIETRSCLITINTAREAVMRGGSYLEILPGLIVKIIREESWRAVAPRNRGPFTSFAEFLTHRLPDGFECSFERLFRICVESPEATELLRKELPAVPEQEIGKGKPGPGRSPRSTQGESKSAPETADNVSRLSHGNSSTYLAARLQRDRPELLDEIGPGKRLRSTRAAAIEAGIIRVPSPLEMGKKAFTKMDDQARKDFLEWARNFP